MRRKNTRKTMIKKIYLMVLCMLLTAMIAGCGSKPQDNTSDMKNKLKIGVLYSSSKENGGYTNVHYSGIKSALYRLGLDYDKVVIDEENVENTDSECVLKIRNLIQQGCDVIIGTSKDYYQDMAALAELSQYKNIKFMNYTNHFTGKPNMVRYFGDMSEAVFLSGLAAGSKTTKNKIGYIIKKGDTGGILYANAFALGVYAADPNGMVYIKEIDKTKDQKNVRNAAEQLIQNEGCDIIAECIDSLIPHRVSDERSVLSIVNCLERSFDIPKRVMCSTAWNWEAFYQEEITKILNGNWSEQDYTKDIGSKAIALKWNAVDYEKGPTIDEYTKRMEKGTFKVFGGRTIKDNKGNIRTTKDIFLSTYDLNNMDWLVENITVR